MCLFKTHLGKRLPPAKLLRDERFCEEMFNLGYIER